MSALVCERAVPMGRETLKLVARQDECGAIWIATECGVYASGDWQPVGPLFRLRPAHLRAVASALCAMASELGVRP